MHLVSVAKRPIHTKIIYVYSVFSYVIVLTCGIVHGVYFTEARGWL